MGDAIIPNAASYLQLYSDANERPSTEWQVECKDAGVTFKDAKDRDWVFKAQAYKFQDKAGANEIDLRVKVAQGDSERAANASAAAVADNKAVMEDARAKGVEAGLQSSIDAEIALRGSGDAALALADTTNVAAAAAATAAEATRAGLAEGVLTAAIAAEEVRAKAREDANELAMANLIGAAPATLQNLQALITEYSTMDSDQETILQSLLSDVATMRDELDILCNL